MTTSTKIVLSASDILTGNTNPWSKNKFPGNKLADGFPIKLRPTATIGVIGYLGLQLIKHDSGIVGAYTQCRGGWALVTCPKQSLNCVGYSANGAPTAIPDALFASITALRGSATNDAINAMNPRPYAAWFATGGQWGACLGYMAALLGIAAGLIDPATLPAFNLPADPVADKPATLDTSSATGVPGDGAAAGTIDIQPAPSSTLSPVDETAGMSKSQLKKHNKSLKRKTAAGVAPTPAVEPADLT